MKQFTFEDLPDLIGKLNAKIDNIEKLLKESPQSDTNIENDILTIEEASKILKLAVATIYTKVCKNEIPVNKQGKRLYFCKTELLEWIKSGRNKTIVEMQHDFVVKQLSK